MYAYRYRHLKKKKINGAVWLGGLLLAVIGILLQTNRSFFAKLGEEGAKEKGCSMQGTEDPEVENLNVLAKK